MYYLLLVALLPMARGIDTDAPCLPDIDYLGLGYDIVHGNPHENQLDPGFSQAIFYLNYRLGDTSGDGKWLLPAYVEAHQVDGCSLFPESQEITGTSSYRNALYADASVKVHRKGDKVGFEFSEFSASAEFNKIRENTMSDHKLYVVSKAKCSRYVARITQRTFISLTESFIRSVKDLPVNNPTNVTYLEFISIFGTHYISEVTMGAKYVITSEFDEATWSSMQRDGISVSAAASISAMRLYRNVSANVSTDDAQANISKAFEENRNSWTESYLGSRPPQDGNWETWAKNAGNRPYPISYVLRPITDLLIPSFFLDVDLENLRKKRHHLNETLMAYCGSVENCGRMSADYYPTKLDGAYAVMRYKERVACRPGYTLLSCGQQPNASTTKEIINRYVIPVSDKACQCQDDEVAVCSAWCADDTFPKISIATNNGTGNVETMCATGQKVSGCYVMRNTSTSQKWANSIASPIVDGDLQGCNCTDNMESGNFTCYASCLKGIENHEIRMTYGIGEVTVYCSDGNYVLGCSQAYYQPNDQHTGYLVTQNSTNSCTCNSDYGATCYALCGQFE